MRFEFATAGRIIFGPGTYEEFGSIAGELGRRALVVCGSSPGRIKPLLAMLETANTVFSSFEVRGEPTVAQVADGVNQAREAKSDLVIGIGGGGVIDSAKEIAALGRMQGGISHFWECMDK